MPGRKYQAGTTSYRYSINGQEKENELNENITTAQYWEYDSRIGRRWNVDPVTNAYESPYLCFSGNPIVRVDFNGDEAADNGKPKKKKTSNGTTPSLLKTKPSLNASESTNPCPSCPKPGTEVKKKPLTSSTQQSNISQDKYPYGTPQSKALKEEYRKNKALVGATMDPLAGVIVYQISSTVYEVVTSPIKNVNRIYEGAQDKSYWEIAKGSLGLALDLAPFIKVPGLSAASKADDLVTLCRTIDAAEANVILKTQTLSFGPNGSTMKQFWISDDAYNTYINTANGQFANGYKLQIQVPKSYIGERKLFNTEVQVDEFLFKPNSINTVTLEGQAGLDAANKNIKSFIISKE